MVSAPVCPHSDIHEQVAHYFSGLASELRLLEPGDLANCINARLDGTLEEIVDCASELSFKPGSVRYGDWAEAVIDWQEAPRFTIALEFRNLDVTAFISLTVGARHAQLSVDSVLYPDAVVVHDEQRRRLLSALDDASLGCRPGAGGKPQASLHS